VRKRAVCQELLTDPFLTPSRSTILLARYSMARLFKLVAVSGCSGRRAFCRIRSTSCRSGSAGPVLAVAGDLAGIVTAPRKVAKQISSQTRWLISLTFVSVSDKRGSGEKGAETKRKAAWQRHRHWQDPEQASSDKAGTYLSGM
jgi:hypothetical protein